MKDITITFDPAGFYVIDAQNYQDLKNGIVITTVNGEIIKVDLKNLDERVYSPANEITKYDAILVDAQAKKAEAVAIAEAIDIIKPKPMEEPPVDTLPSDTPPEPSPSEVSNP